MEALARYFLRILISLFIALLAACVPDRAHINPTIIIHQQGNQSNAFRFSQGLGENAISHVKWSFGDGYYSHETSPTHQYLSPGQYQVTLEFTLNQQPQVFHRQLQVDGEQRHLLIHNPSALIFDSDHNDPHQVYVSNNIHAQPLPQRAQVSGIVLAKNACQAGKLCQSGDLLDRYEFSLRSGSGLKIEIIKGSIDVKLQHHLSSKQDEFTNVQQTLNLNPLDAGHYQLAIHLNEGAATAQYLIHLGPDYENQSPTHNSHYQPGKRIVLWKDNPVPELVDISDRRLYAPSHATQARKLNANIQSISYNYFRQAHQFNYQPYHWWLDLIGSNEINPQALTQEGEVTIAVLDTGILAHHVALQDSQIIDGYDFISDPLNAADGDGWDPFPIEPVQAQSQFHGSHITGLISSNIMGLAPNAKIMPLRVLGRHGATSYDLIQALRYAAGLPNDSGQIARQPADVINLSLGGNQYSAAEQATIRQVLNSGIIVVAASGNDAAKQVNFPSAYDGVISVGASTSAAEPAHYSNSGRHLDLLAPGGNCFDSQCRQGILSLGHPEHSPWQFMSGTSMASAQVSALLSHLKARWPGLDRHDVETLLQTGQISEDLLNTGFDEQSGWGMVNINKIFTLLENYDGKKVGAWTPQYHFYPDENELISLPIFLRGKVDPAQLDIELSSVSSTGEKEKLQVNLIEQSLNISIKQALTDTTSVVLSLDKQALMTVYLHPPFNGPVFNYNPHLYIQSEQQTSLRSVAWGNGWQANLPKHQQPFQVSSDIDFDGVYCEPGELCNSLDHSNAHQNLEVQAQFLSH